MAFRQGLLASMLLFVIATSAGAADRATGGGTLVAALDAAWVRVLDKDVFRRLVAAHGMQDVVVNISDCLPKPEVTHYPEQPTGTLQQILDAGRVNVGVSATGLLDEGATATPFIKLSDDLLAAVFDELAAHYDVDPIEINYVTIQPPFPITSTLNSGGIDIVGLVNALGGETEDLRRRDSRRFTCTMTSTRQIIWVRKDGGPEWRDVNEALDDSDIELCVGPLSNQLTNAYFDRPGQNVKTEYVQDLKLCLAKLMRGDIDAMVSPFPHERFFPAQVDTTGDGKPDTPTAGALRSIDTNIVAGTPLWIALD